MASRVNPRTNTTASNTRREKEAALSVEHATQFPSIISAFSGGAAESAFDLSHSLLARGVAGHCELSMRIAAGNRRPIGRFKDTVLRPPA